MEKDPAFGADFYDREIISSILIKRVEAFREGYHQNIGLVGKRYIGKSSILQNFVLSSYFSDIIPIYIEVRGESFADFAKRFMGMVLVGYFQSVQKTMPHGIEEMIKMARRELPVTTKKMVHILQRIKKHRLTDAFHDLFSLAVILSEEVNKKIVMVIDEFSLFEQLDVKDPFAIFGKQIMTQKNTMFIVSSSCMHAAQEIFTEKLSLLFGNFEIIKVKPFDFKTSKNFIKSRLAPYEVPLHIIRFIMRITDGQPYYLSVLIKKIKAKADRLEAGQINDGLLLAVLEEEIYFMDGQIAQHFSLKFAGLFGTKRRNYLNVLVSIAFGHKKALQIARFTEDRAEEVRKMLGKLYVDEIIDKNGSFYFIDDPMLCFWLQYAYNLRRISLKINKSLLNAEFKRRVRCTLDEYTAEDNKDIAKKVAELFLSFKNDTIELDKKRQKFPAFTNLSSFPADGHVFMTVKSAQYRWACNVVLHKVTEDDVQLFVQEAKRHKTVFTKKVLIYPYGIDINAKLMAKEAKLFLWSLRDLNCLLHLSGQPKLIVEHEAVVVLPPIPDEVSYAQV